MKNTQMGNLRRKGGWGIEPLFTWHGRDIYPPFGAEGEGEGEGEPNGESDDDTGAGDGDGGAGETVSREDFDKLRNQLSASDKNRAAAEKKLQEIEDAKKDELTKATERAETLEKQVAQQGKELSDLRLKNAFLMADPGITWHDPGDALALAERNGYLDGVVGEDGSVDAKKLAGKLKELAKAKPNLVKTESSTGDGTTTETGQQRSSSSTGQRVGSKGSTGGSQQEKLPTRYDRFLNR